MRKAILTTLVGAAILTLSSASVQAEVTSLRGSNKLDSPANAIEKFKQNKVQGGIERSWELQPPSIPHSIDKDRITIRENTCLKCHSKANFEKEKAPEIAESHYIARDGSTLEKPSARRHFCNQCHAPQVDTDPLVQNTF